MNIQFEFGLSSIKTENTIGNFSDVVIECNYNVTVTPIQESLDLNYSDFKLYYSGGNIKFNVSELNENSFIPFDQIDKDILISWIMEKENVSSLGQIEFVKNCLLDTKQEVIIVQLQEETKLDEGWKVTDTIDLDSIS